MIRGEETTRYAATIEPAEIPKHYKDDPLQTARLVKRLGDTPVGINVYIGADGLPRRINLVMRIEGHNADLTIDLSEFGVEVSPQEPPKAQTTDMATLLKSRGG
jgi:hypothetical protein